MGIALRKEETDVNVSEFASLTSIPLSRSLTRKYKYAVDAIGMEILCLVGDLSIFRTSNLAYHWTSDKTGAALKQLIARNLVRVCSRGPSRISGNTYQITEVGKELLRKVAADLREMQERYKYGY